MCCPPLEPSVRVPDSLFKVLRSLRLRRPTYDHAAQRVPSISENENHMRYNEENKKPHQPEVPDTGFVITTKNPGQPIELHGFVNSPSREERQEPGNRDREISEALKCVVFCVE